MHELTRRWCLLALVVSSPAWAVGATQDWTTCSKEPWIQADPNGRAFYVSTTATDPSTCPGAGATFRTVQAALNCAQGGDTIYVRAGTHTAATSVSNKAYSRQVLVTPYPNEYPAFDVPISGGAYTAVFAFNNVQNLAIQGLVVQDYANRTTSARGIWATNMSNFKVVHNTVRYLGYGGIGVSGTNIRIAANDVHDVSLKAASGGFTEDGIAVAAKDPIPGDPAGASARNFVVVLNDVHEVYGECIGLYKMDGGAATSNRVHDCVGVGIYTGSQNLRIDKNLIYQQTDTYLSQGSRMVGIALGTEQASDPFYPNHITIENNIILGTDQGVRFNTYKDQNRGTGSTPDKYGFITIAYNDFDKIIHNPVKIDAPGSVPDAGNFLRANAAVSEVSLAYIDTYYTGYWNDGGNQKYTAAQLNSSSVMGWLNRDNFPASAPVATDYKLLSTSILKDGVLRSTAPVTVSDDFFCVDRTTKSTNSVGAVEYVP